MSQTVGLALRHTTDTEFVNARTMRHTFLTTHHNVDRPADDSSTMGLACDHCDRTIYVKVDSVSRRNRRRWKSAIVGGAVLVGAAVCAAYFLSNVGDSTPSVAALIVSLLAAVILLPVSISILVGAALERGVDLDSYVMGNDWSHQIARPRRGGP